MSGVPRYNKSSVGLRSVPRYNKSSVGLRSVPRYNKSSVGLRDKWIRPGPVAWEGETNDGTAGTLRLLSVRRRWTVE